MFTSKTRRVTVLGAVLGFATLTACAEDKPAATDDSTGPVTVKATDSACDLSRRDVKSGTHEFSVTNGGSKVTEFYVYAEGDRVMAEVENIAPGLSRDLLVELPAGEYETACKPGMIGDGIRNPLTVTGEAAQLSEDESLAQAAVDYQRYVQSQTAALLEQTTAFTSAVKAGDIPGAKALYPVRSE